MLFLLYHSIEKRIVPTHIFIEEVSTGYYSKIAKLNCYCC